MKVEFESLHSAPTPSLQTLDDMQHNKIILKKGEIHKSHDRAYNDKLWIEIEMLHWILTQILTTILFAHLKSVLLGWH